MILTLLVANIILYDDLKRIPTALSKYYRENIYSRFSKNSDANP